MITLQALVMTAALATPGQAILLDFYSDYCGPCRDMQPTIQRLIADGYDVRKINIDQRRDLAQRYQVNQIPTFVMLSDGKEVDRLVGARPYDHLRQMFVAVGPPIQPAVQLASNTQPLAAAPPASFNAGNPQKQALYATVRLRVEDETGNSFGTGTIIDARHNEALVITCGHLFRSSSGKGRIEVDLFAPGAKGPVPGKLLSYDLKNDVALVTIWPGMEVTPAPVAIGTHQLQVGDGVFSIGCDRGADASIRTSRVTALNKYLGPANIEVAGQPVIGRSGGGLFTADGRLIGVCNLADPKDDEGIYAALSLVHGHLAANLPSGILQQNTQIAQNAAPAPAPPLGMSLAATTPPPPMARQMPEMPATSNPSAPPTDRLTAAINAMGDDAEVICIIRSKTDPNAGQQTLVFDQAPRSLMTYLAAEHSRMRGQQPTQLRASDPTQGVAIAPPDRYRNSSEGETLRGQNRY